MRNSLKMFAVAAALFGFANQATSEETVLRAVSFLPLTIGTNGVHVSEFVDRVNTQMAGSLRIEVLGGPESIAYPDQPNALRTGVVDMGFLSGSQIYRLLPINDYLAVTELMPPDRRGMGIYDAVDGLFQERMNSHLLGEHLLTMQATLYFGELSEDRVARISKGDFAGLRMRGGSSYDGLYEALGIEGYAISPGDIYTAVERGTVEGYAWPTLDMMSQGWGEITDYRLGTDFLHSAASALINMESWNSLTDEQRAQLDAIAQEWEAWSTGEADKLIEAELQAQMAAGVKIIELDEEKVPAFLAATSRNTWISLSEKLPELFALVAKNEPAGLHFPEDLRP